MKKTFFGFRISPDLLKEVREQAEKEQRTVTTVMERAIRSYLTTKNKES